MRPTTKEEAQKLADEMKSVLEKDLGGEWHTRVWYNLWWCYECWQGTIRVTQHWDKYSALVGVDEGYGGLPEWSDDSTYDSPSEAVRQAFKAAVDYTTKLTSVIGMNARLIEKLGK